MRPTLSQSEYDWTSTSEVTDLDDHEADLNEQRKAQ